ncbi:putative C2 domain-containing protein [Helianthus annuus]|uniref:C2 domain-containing protein n=1 Tax=Helianthus annuus TaxID=4232 RepID=A0A9K3NSK2_HELAN|nr:elicitor-responsive protein 3-like [Helianthus annuus]KAF5811657.1 putative C2 domain-containing protein [Helianthus annuus]KAJ0590485.1 putative C2 domain-containing protein [Helianthus annuus]
MPEGVLEVLLVSAKGLEDADLLCKMDPYVIITYRTQEKKSTVASGKGTTPEWNETFLFDVTSNDATDLKVKIMDSDGGVGADDLVGHASIPLDALFRDGDIPAKSYNIMKDDAYCGEIRIGLNFTVQKSRGFDPTDGNIGGWKQSGRD